MKNTIENLKNKRAQLAEQRQRMLLQLATAVAHDEDLPADAEKQLTEHNIGVEEIEQLAAVITRNDERLNEIAELERQANELTPECAGPAANAAALAKARDAISLQMAEKREAAERDPAVRLEISALEKDRKHAIAKLQAEVQVIRQLAGEQSQLRSQIEELRAELEPVQDAIPAIEATERSTIEVPDYSRPGIVPTPPPGMRPIETIGELMRQGVSLPQIALIYGLREWEVQAENDCPGFVLGREGYRDPRWAKYEKRQAEQAADHKALYEERKRAVEQPRGKVRKPCPESPYELWAQGVSVEQAARMLQKTESEVHGMFEDFKREAADAPAERYEREQTELDRRLAERLGQPLDDDDENEDEDDEEGHESDSDDANEEGPSESSTEASDVASEQADAIDNAVTAVGTE